MIRPVLGLCLALAAASCSRPAEIEVSDAWTRDTVGRTAAAAVFMTIAAPAADRLVGASSPLAGKTDLMTMHEEDGAMAMAYLEAIDLPAGTPVELDPSGLHVWLADLARPLAAGETFPLTLEFENAAPREVTVRVIEPAAPAPMPGMAM